MSGKLQLHRPTLILLYGFPGSGKSYFARQLTQEVQSAHVQGDRIRYELFENPKYDKQENKVVEHLMQYMTEEFLQAGISVVYDVNALRVSQRRELRELARRNKVETMLIWFQIDGDSAFQRVYKRDRRKLDDKFTPSIDKATFDRVASAMQNPQATEEYMVISGKHTYQTQRSTVIKKLYDTGLLSADNANAKVVMPGLVNLIPTPLAGRVDTSRRNISIR